MCSTRGTAPGAARALDAAGVTRYDLGRQARWDAHRLLRLAPLIRRHRIDIVHTHLFGPNVSGTAIARLCQVPVVIAHEHTWAYQGNPLRRLLDGQVIGRLATRFVAVSSADARRMVEIEGVRSDKVVVMPTAYIPRAAGRDGDLRAELGLKADTPLVVTAVVLRRQKALGVMIDAFGLVLSDLPDAHLAIAGDGPERDTLERRVRAAGLERSIHFLGLRDDVDAIVARADVGALSSDYEGMPLFAFECIANRTPLVATAVGGLPDLLENGRSGILVAPRDHEALARALTGLLRNAPLRAQIAASAAPLIEPYRIQAVAARFADLYDQLLAEARS